MMAADRQTNKGYQELQELTTTCQAAHQDPSIFLKDQSLFQPDKPAIIIGFLIRGNLTRWSLRSLPTMMDLPASD